MARGRARTSLYVAAFVVLLVRPSAAQTAPSTQGAGEAKKACIVQHEAAQNFRRTGKLLEARDAILVCSRDECPAVVRADCGEWLELVSKTIPTLVIRAKEDDKDVFDVRIWIDGTIVKSQLGTPIELNPGAHTLRFERDHFDPIDQEILVLEGEKNRVVAANFARALPPAPVQSLPNPHERDTPPPVESYRPVPALTYVFGGLALAGAGGFAALAISGQSEKKALESSCRPVCTDDELQPVRTRFMLADASLGIAVVSTVVAGVIYFTRPTKPLATGASPAPNLRPAPIAFGFTPAAMGAQFAMQTEF
jgi:hypothetical protein